MAAANGSGGASGAAGSTGTAGTAGDGADGGNLWFGEESVTLDRTVVALATSGGDCSEPVETSTFSADSDGTCGVTDTTDIGTHTAGELALGPLGFDQADDPTPVRLPQAGSVLLDAIPEADCTLDSDQRDAFRPQGNGCEVGAAEVRQPAVLGVVKTADPSTVTVGDSATFTVVVSNTGGVGIARADLTFTDDLCTLAFVSGDADGDNVLDDGESWTYNCSVATTAAGTLTNHVTVDSVDQDGNTQTASDDAAVTVQPAAVGGAGLARTGANRVGPLVNLGLLLIAIGMFAFAWRRRVLAGR
jgi:uncharacterized repeat protein (TIGR01451 family)